MDSDPLETVAIKVLRVGAHSDEIGNTSVAREFESLERLQHKHIVRMIEAGLADGTNQRFIALEWVDSSMHAYVGAGEPDPDGFIGGIGIRVSEAMAFAHENDVAHRDLKPSNVLIAEDGSVKVADFGISRLIDWLDERPVKVAATLADYASPPFAPPERDAGAVGRDVWGLGATLLSGLVRRELHDYDDLRAAKSELSVVGKLEQIVLDCLADDPKRRPADCRVVHARLHQYWRGRQIDLADRVAVYIEVSLSAAKAMDATDADEAAREAAADLSDTPCITLARNDRGEAQQYLLYGDAQAYRVAIDAPVGRSPLPRLFVIATYEPSSSESDRARARGLALEYVDFRAGIPADRAQAQEALEQVLDHVAQHDAESRARERESEAARVLDQWRRQIEARTWIESDREQPITYRAVQREGRRAVFTVKGATDGVQLGETRRAIAASGVRAFVRGEVEDVDGSKVTLYLDEGVEGIPASGKLVVDTRPSRVKIDRERAAIDVLAYTPTKAARDDLGYLLFHPGANRLPDVVEIRDWAEPKLDASKRAAVQAALGSSDLFVVQGPPGTGKTTFIAELVVQELRRNPRAKILISSQTNVALDNALDRIDRLGEDWRIIRLADPKHGKVSPEAERFRVEGQLRQWREMAEVKSNSFLEAWVDSGGMSLAKVNESKFLRELASFRELQATLERELSELESQVDGEPTADGEVLTERELDERLQEVLDRMSEAEESQRAFELENRSLVNKYQSAVDSGGAAELRQQADELLGGSDRANELRSLVQLQAEWLQRLGRGEGFVAALAQDSAVIGATCIGLAAVQELSEAQFDLCIIDECSKATAMETLVPMIRSRRWVLVGDERQLPPMVEEALRDRSVIDEFDLDEHELTTTLFSRLADSLPLACQQMLNEQHRMVKPIGELISECFYDGELKSVGPRATARVPGVLPKPVTWHDTSKVKDRYEQRSSGQDHSYVNTLEALTVTGLLKRLSKHFRRSDKRPTVLVLAPYSAQIRELRRRVDQLGELDAVSVEIATVDAVQGREADYVIFCITRSNTRHDPGFLRLEARANVALSRAKFGLAIVGDLAFCRTTDTPFKDVAHYVTTHSRQCARVEVDR